ncbi:L,D-transpeptidase family protein [Allosphingosinicella vermicomposti]|uniref:L,D-transpeptidase family protein n=1 Tax=Allosphingosinicella vermicomposti TaxID=614671 RepID=UPI001FDFC394|nr:L,D-transpeptidase family protein [Allosphingosinicella vermicomposti]
MPALLAFASPAMADVRVPTTLQELKDEIRAEGGKKEIREFYRARDYRPVWVSGTVVRPEADRLVALLQHAGVDGLDPDDYKPRALAAALAKARTGDAEALAEVELRLSRAYADYARDVAKPGKLDIHYVDPELAPDALSRRAALDALGAAPSLRTFLDTMGWMHPSYGALRAAYIAAPGRYGPAERQILNLNLDRLRTLPAQGRYVLVDAAAQRLYLYDNGKVQDSMRVVVGKESQQTPMMAGFIRYTAVNPYWNVPPDLVAERIAPHVLSSGLPYLQSRGYEILSDWSDNAVPVDPTRIDWRAVANGATQLRVRQKPGPANAMGRMKFMFPNKLGVYLHDTPDKDLFGDSDRRASAGCVRLEDAPRLARWLYGKPVAVPRGKPEQRLDLPKPVPVYITYLTAAADKGRIAFRDDIYNRDGIQLAGGSYTHAAAR